METDKMNEPNVVRPFRQRFLENFERSQLRREVEKVRPQRLSGIRRRGAALALGATLAVGGLGVPLSMLDQQPRKDARSRDEPGGGLEKNLARDLRMAGAIATEVAGGVQSATENPLKKVGSVPAKIAAQGRDVVQEEFFRKEVPFGTIIYKEAKRNNIRPELVAAVVEAESRFKPTARSGAGAVGLMQLVPRTGRWMGAKDLTNPVQNISAGTKYLKYLHERFDGNETKVIAAYNAGEGNVKRFGGIPPFRETRNYVQKVRKYERDYHSRIENRSVEIAAADLGGDQAAAR